MELRVFGADSGGNCYALKTDGGETLILDAGVPIRRVIRQNRGLSGVVGCLVTHEHGDHVSAARDFLRYGVDVFATPGTIEAAGLSGDPNERGRIHPIRRLNPFKTGSFTVLGFPTEHDAKEPCGFLIRYEQTGETLLYATDTYYLRYKFPGVHYWMLECNYIDEVVDQQMEDGEIPEVVRRRLKRSHMSLRRAKDALSANDMSKTRLIVLIHLSGGRSDERVMIEAVKEATGIQDVVAAKEGDVIRLSLTPF